jgi:hypothetical protein
MIRLLEKSDCDCPNEYGCRDGTIEKELSVSHADLSQCNVEQAGAEEREASVGNPEEDVAGPFDLDVGHRSSLLTGKRDPKLVKTLTIPESAWLIAAPESASTSSSASKPVRPFPFDGRRNRCPSFQPHDLPAVRRESRAWLLPHGPTQLSTRSGGL